MNTSTDLEPTAVELSDAATMFGALAEPARLRILAALSERERCVCEIRDAVDLPPNLLSYHLRILREAGLITATRRGRWIDYRLDPAAVDRLAARLASAGLGRGARSSTDPAVLAAACAGATP